MNVLVLNNTLHGSGFIAAGEHDLDDDLALELIEEGLALAVLTAEEIEAQGIPVFDTEEDALKSLEQDDDQDDAEKEPVKPAASGKKGGKAK